MNLPNADELENYEAHLGDLAHALIAASQTVEALKKEINNYKVSGDRKFIGRIEKTHETLRLDLHSVAFHTKTNTAINNGDPHALGR